MEGKKKLQTPIPIELDAELGERAKSMGISKASLVTLCLRAGLDVIKVSLGADYVKLMQELAKKYEIE